MKKPKDLGKNEKDPTDLGANRTGVASSPVGTAKAVEYAAKFVVPNAEPSALDDLRLLYSREAEPVGSMAPPLTVKGMAKTAIQALKGHKASVFLDLLGERLAFERSGTRIYESILIKFDASEPRPGGPTRSELEEIRNDELSHFLMLNEAIKELGADPTMMTPSADTTFVASSGIVKLVQDSRTTLTQALKGALVAELTDGDGWLLLSDLAEQLDQQELAARFRAALVVEERHLASVRSWVTSAVEGQAGVDKAESAATETRPIG
jgi:rubrerythrin